MASGLREQASRRALELNQMNKQPKKTPCIQNAAHSQLLPIQMCITISSASPEPL